MIRNGVGYSITVLIAQWRVKLYHSRGIVGCMIELASKKFASIDTEQKRSLRSLLLTFVMTPLLLIPEPIRNIVSMDATIAAVTIGVIAGVVVSFALDRLQIRVQNDVRTTIAAFVSTGVAMILCWIVIPTELLQTVPHFSLAFIWSFSIISVARDIIWPKAIDSVHT
jgi:phage shock protein PspC (stress-responsive transcriptional regulator)